jgi:hypothetical protein
MANLDRQTYKSSWNPNVAEMVIKVSDDKAAVAGTYSASVTIPAGAYIQDVQVYGVELWNPTGACTLDVGCRGDVDFFWNAVNLKSGGELLVDEVLSFAHVSAHTKIGDGITDDDGVMKTYLATPQTITANITTVTDSGTTGETRIVVLWVKPTDSTTSTFVAT